MKKIALISIILVLIIKIYLAKKYNITLSFNSDDINYLNSAKVLLEKGMLTYKYNDIPTVFITPIYPLFLAIILKIFGNNNYGEIVIRILQIILSTINLYLIYCIAKKILDKDKAYVAVFLANIYIPNISTPLYLVSETLFMTLFLASINISLILRKNFNIKNMTMFSVLWSITILTRPMVVIIPIIVFLWYLIIYKITLKTLIKYGLYGTIIFVLIMCPWWIRNYNIFGEVIVLTKSVGNPMLQGAFIDYKVIKEDIKEYKEINSVYKLDDAEKKAAQRIAKEGFHKNFFKYLYWYTIGKTIKLWKNPFYWRYILYIKNNVTFIMHYIYLMGFIGLFYYLKQDKIASLFLAILLYINILSCITYSFSRYSYPFMSFIIIYFVALLYKAKAFLRKS